MSANENLTPLERAALLEALRSPTHSLVRMGRHFVAQERRTEQSGTRKVTLFTGRVMNRLDRRALVDFDPPQFPERVVLNRRGLVAAQALDLAAKAVRA